MTAEYFDSWYADMTGSPRKDVIQQRHLGLPPELLSTSLLTWEGLAEVVAALHLAPGDVLLDLACGRGGYGLEVSARTGAVLVGLDFSGEAVRQARENAARLGRHARFAVGDLAATGLDDASVAAVLCVDAVQFALDREAVFREMRRVLRPGGRIAVTTWEAVDHDDEQLPERLRGLEVEAGFVAAGFTEIDVSERPAWRRAEQAMWQEAAALDPGDDAALRAFHEEGVRATALFGRLRRVLGTATAP